MKFALSVLAFLLFLADLTLAQCREDVVDLRGPWGQAHITVELAATDADRARGLMHREHLPASAGMLFLYDSPQPVAFWMKNTLIPLDMLFVDARGVVTRVHHQARPHDLTAIEGGDGIVAVLEINGGLAKRLGLGEGSDMRHPHFTAPDAVWPCD